MIPYLGESLENSRGEGLKNSEPLPLNPHSVQEPEKQDGAAQAESNAHSKTPQRRQSMKNKILWFLFALSLVAASSATAKNYKFRYGGGNQPALKVPEGKVLEGNKYLGFGAVEMAGEVTGDLVVAGGSVKVSGKVGEDLWVAGGEVSVSDSVGDDVRAAGGEVTLSAPIGGDLMCFAGNTEVDSGCRVAGKAMIATGELVWAGEAGKGLEASAGSITLRGTVHGDAVLKGGTISVEPGTVIEGDLVYTTAQEAKISPQAVIQGKTEHKTPPPEKARKKRFPLFRFLSFWAWSLGSLLLGSLLVSLFPRMGEAVIAKIRAVPKAFLAGFVILALAPAVILVLLLSVLGVPIGLTLLVSVLFALIASSAFAGLALGKTLLSLLTRKPAQGWFWAMALGVFLIQLLGLIPCLGFILKLLVAIAGVGGIYLALVGAMRKGAEARA